MWELDYVMGSKKWTYSAFCSFSYSGLDFQIYNTTHISCIIILFTMTFILFSSMKLTFNITIQYHFDQKLHKIQQMTPLLMISVLKGSLLELVFTLKYWNCCLIWSNFEMLCCICNYWKLVVFYVIGNFSFHFFSTYTDHWSCILEPIYFLFFLFKQLCNNRITLGTGYSLSSSVSFQCNSIGTPHISTGGRATGLLMAAVQRHVSPPSTQTRSYSVSSTYYEKFKSW